MTKENKWQYHKNPEQDLTDHQDKVDFKNQAASTGLVDLTETDLPPEKKQNIVSIILSGFPRFVWWVTM